MKFSLLLLATALALAAGAAPRDRFAKNKNNNYYGSHAQASQQNKYVSSSGGGHNDHDMQIVRKEQEIHDDGSYRFAYETSNGIVGDESGMGGVAVQGSSSYVSPEGVAVKLTYTADENGYHPVGDHIPKTPDYILRALEYIRTHPPKDNNNDHDHYKSSQSKSSSNYQLSAHIAPPTRKAATSRRVTPAPARHGGSSTFGRSQQYGNNNYKSSKYFKY